MKRHLEFDRVVRPLTVKEMASSANRFCHHDSCAGIPTHFGEHKVISSFVYTPEYSAISYLLCEKHAEGFTQPDPPEAAWASQFALNAAFILTRYFIVERGPFFQNFKVTKTALLCRKWSLENPKKIGGRLPKTTKDRELQWSNLPLKLWGIENEPINI